MTADKNIICIICDISFLGIEFGKKAGIPTVLIENFTWDWIYQNYALENAEINRYADIIKKIYENTDIWIQTEPVCVERKNRALKVHPISREKRKDRKTVRNMLGLSDDDKVVLLTMGGVREKNMPVKRMMEKKGYVFIIPGGSERKERVGNLILLPFHSEFYHPDLIGTADIVVAKAGYSTLAEVYCSEAKFLYIKREMFKEVEFLEKFIVANMPDSKGCSYSDFVSALWLDFLDELCYSKSKTVNLRYNGSEDVASFILKKFL